MKRIIGFFTLFLVWFYPPLVFASDEHIPSFLNDIALNKDGTIQVIETILYNFEDNNRHGIFRDIPFIKTNDEGKRYVLDVNDVRVVDQQNADYRYSQSQQNDTLQLKIGDPNQTITGSHTYTISYRVSGALTYFSDHDELYWNVTGNDWDVPIKNVQTTVRMPEHFGAQQVHLACFTGTTRSSASDCRTSYKDGTVVVSADSLLPREGLTVVVGFPKGAVSVLEPMPYVSFFETMWGKIVLALLIIVAFVWYVVVPGIVIYRWWRYGRDPKPAMGVVSAWFDTPKTRMHRRLRPAETGTLIDEVVNTSDITGTIIDLAQRGYLKIIETTKEQFLLEKLPNPKDDETLLSFEEIVLAEFFKSANTVKLKDANLSSSLSSIKSAIYDQVVRDGFFPKSPQSIRTLYGVVAVLALITGNLLLALISFTFGMGMPRKTFLGASEAAVGKSLKNFLSSQHEKLAFQAKNQMFFEKFLPYAVAFGVEKIWAERFREIHLTKPDWYEGSYTNSLIFTRSLGSGLSRSFSYATTIHSSSGFSSGFSGGSSGGGGGGGGGGSW